MTERLLSHTHASRLPSEALQSLHALLVGERQTQIARASEHEATARLLAGHTDGDSVLERELAILAATRARETIGDIDRALKRITTGTYGHCEVCGRTLPLERLEAIPYARRCVACPSDAILRTLPSSATEQAR